VLLAEVEHVPHRLRFIREKRLALGLPAQV